MDNLIIIIIMTKYIAVGDSAALKQVEDSVRNKWRWDWLDKYVAIEGISFQLSAYYKKG